jgi:hypothetical protein
MSKKSKPFNVTITTHPAHTASLAEHGFEPIDTPADGVFAVIDLGDGRLQTIISHMTPVEIAAALSSSKFGRTVFHIALAHEVAEAVADDIFGLSDDDDDDDEDEDSGGAQMTLDETKVETSRR